jgi:NADPH:quinone reductase-like Zn-dependent oxidoreductase
LAKAAGLIIIATASRPETTDWVTQLGADHVINTAKIWVRRCKPLVWTMSTTSRSSTT